MRQWKWLALRLIISGLFGVTIAWLALLAGLHTARSSVLTFPQQITRHDLSRINQAITAYRQMKHTLPRSLGELESRTGNSLRLEDGWGHPFVYIVVGSRYQVISYGRDGKPGGTGLDTDLTSDNINPPGAELTLHQFLTLPETQGMVMTACLSGVLAGLLCLVTLRPKTLTGPSILALAVQLLVTLMAAAFVATVITALHVPSGH
ncbi:MAG: type II secretion system protein GspG [Armatimonadetes bacterium]|nr:type II secretion system protein GspG [Armatimonadota bacterium]